VHQAKSGFVLKIDAGRLAACDLWIKIRRVFDPLLHRQVAIHAMCGIAAPQGAVDHETFLERKVLSGKGQLLSKKNKMAHAEKLESWHRRTGRYATEGKVQHFVVLDRLILEYPETIIWIGKRDGSVEVAEYVAAERAVVVNFTESFANAERLFALPGVRRALIAYWAEALADLRQRKAKSVYARYHSYDAVSKLMEYKRANDAVFRDAAEAIRPTAI
jgi:hypothetical protein